MPATMSVYGMYQYDNTLFNGMVLPPAINKAALINYIIAECAELEVSISNPDTLKVMIESWSLARLHSWVRLYESTVQDYNMIENYDRHEEWTDKGKGEGHSKNYKAAYNASANVLSDNSDADSKQCSHHEGRTHGNIGVTTAAQMIQGERDINQYDVFQAITDEFKRKFCVCVY